MHIRTLRLALLAGLLLAPAVALAIPTLVVQLRSDMRPWTDFRQVRVTVKNARTGAVITRQTHAVRRAERYDRGVRVLEQRLARAGTTVRITTTALNHRGQTVAERGSRITLRDGASVSTVFLTRPRPAAPSACQSTWSRTKRNCGRVLAQCIAQTRGNRTRLKTCQDAHAVCMRSADRAKRQCEARAR